MRNQPEYIIRNGYMELKNAAAYFSVHITTMYRWAVWRKCYPKGFPKAERIGLKWMIRWSDIQKFEAGLMSREEEKELGLHIGKVDYNEIFEARE